MEMFQERYIGLRSQYIFPLKDYSIKYDKLNYNTIKEKLKTKIKNISIIGCKTYKIEFDKEDLVKGIIADSEFFFTRALVQYTNIINADSDLSPCWMAVSQYYFSYFTTTALLRILSRGNLYLDGEIVKIISNMATLLIGEKIQIDTGNYIFSIKSEDELGNSKLGVYGDNVFMELKYNGSRGTHEQTWISIQEFLEEYIRLDSSKNSEYTILMSMKDIINLYGATFPSKLRNQINYQAPYGYESINKQLQCSNSSITREELLRKICSFDKVNNDENYKLEYMYLYGRFFFELLNKLFSEYYTRSSCNKKFYESKNDYFKERNIDIKEFMNLT